MEISIICPTFNNLNYLRLFIKSIKENSFFNHELIFHINDGSDGSLNFIRSEKIKYTHSNDNIGLCSAVNNAFTKSTKQYILYAHDDMYFCKNWDIFLIGFPSKFHLSAFFQQKLILMNDYAQF